MARFRAVVVIHAPGVRGHAAIGPRPQGLGERLLHGLLGQVEVAEHADEGRDRPSLLLAEQAVDDLPRVGLYDGRDGNSWIGRTSMDAPQSSAGIRDAASMASSRLSHSIR